MPLSQALAELAATPEVPAEIVDLPSPSGRGAGDAGLPSPGPEAGTPISPRPPGEGQGVRAVSLPPRPPSASRSPPCWMKPLQRRRSRADAASVGPSIAALLDEARHFKRRRSPNQPHAGRLVDRDIAGPAHFKRRRSPLKTHRRPRSAKPHPCRPKRSPRPRTLTSPPAHTVTISQAPSETRLASAVASGPRGLAEHSRPVADHSRGSHPADDRGPAVHLRVGQQGPGPGKLRQRRRRHHALVGRRAKAPGPRPESRAGGCQLEQSATGPKPGPLAANRLGRNTLRRPAAGRSRDRIARRRPGGLAGPRAVGEHDRARRKSRPASTFSPENSTSSWSISVRWPRSRTKASLLRTTWPRGWMP